jgi:hypothetical protein
MAMEGDKFDIPEEGAKRIIVDPIDGAKYEAMSMVRVSSKGPRWRVAALLSGSGGNIGILIPRIGEPNADLSVYRPYKSEGFWAKLKRTIMRKSAPEPLFYIAIPRPHNSAVDLDSFKMIGPKNDDACWTELHFVFKFVKAKSKEDKQHAAKNGDGGSIGVQGGMGSSMARPIFEIQPGKGDATPLPKFEITGGRGDRASDEEE